ncbi:MAG: hypothetical protein WC043_02280 [Pseudobdellovibrionaceae bacterium]
MGQNIKSRVVVGCAGAAVALASVFAFVHGGAVPAESDSSPQPETVSLDVASCQILQDSSGAYKALVRLTPEDGERRGRLMYRFQDSGSLFSAQNQGVAEIPRGIGLGAHFEPVGEFVIHADEKACDVHLDGKKAPKRFLAPS